MSNETIEIDPKRVRIDPNHRKIINVSRNDRNRSENRKILSIDPNQKCLTKIYLDYRNLGTVNKSSLNKLLIHFDEHDMGQEEFGVHVDMT